MPYSIFVSEEAETDISIAYEWYEQQKQGLGDEFIHAIEHSFETILSNPGYYGILKKKTKRYIVKRFPYLVIFVIHKTQIRILSVFHTHRKPTT